MTKIKWPTGYSVISRLHPDGGLNFSEYFPTLEEAEAQALWYEEKANSFKPGKQFIICYCSYQGDRYVIEPVDPTLAKQSSKAASPSPNLWEATVTPANSGMPMDCPMDALLYCAGVACGAEPPSMCVNHFHPKGRGSELTGLMLAIRLTQCPPDVKAKALELLALMTSYDDATLSSPELN